MPVSYTSISSSLDDHLLIPSPAGGAGEAAGVGACVWVPATHKGHSDGVSGFWLWPEILRSCGDWNRDGRFLSFFPPSLFITLPLRWIHVSLEAIPDVAIPDSLHLIICDGGHRNAEWDEKSWVTHFLTLCIHYDLNLDNNNWKHCTKLRCIILEDIQSNTNNLRNSSCKHITHHKEIMNLPKAPPTNIPFHLINILNCK